MTALVEQVQMLTAEASTQRDNLRAMEQQRTTDKQNMIALQQQVIAAGQRKERPSFVDVKGIGKPSTFSSEPRQFGTWAFKNWATSSRACLAV